MTQDGEEAEAQAVVGVIVKAGAEAGAGARAVIDDDVAVVQVDPEIDRVIEKMRKRAIR